jgi:hypothetical protein
VVVAGYAAVRDLEAGIAAVGAAVVDIATEVAAAETAAGSFVDAASVLASGLAVGGLAADAAGKDHEEADMIAIRTAVEAEENWYMGAAVAAVAEEGEDQEEAAGNTALPELDSASRNWTLLLKLLARSMFKISKARYICLSFILL